MSIYLHVDKSCASFFVPKKCKYLCTLEMFICMSSGIACQQLTSCVHTTFTAQSSIWWSPVIILHQTPIHPPCPTHTRSPNGVVVTIKSYLLLTIHRSIDEGDYLCEGCSIICKITTVFTRCVRVFWDPACFFLIVTDACSATCIEILYTSAINQLINQSKFISISHHTKYKIIMIYTNLKPMKYYLQWQFWKSNW